jgi:hypothetical protein
MNSEFRLYVVLWLLNLTLGVTWLIACGEDTYEAWEQTRRRNSCLNGIKQICIGMNNHGREPQLAPRSRVVEIIDEQFGIRMDP